jgi:hypothetical protein
MVEPQTGGRENPWIQVAQRAIAGEVDGLECPESGDPLSVEWHAIGTAGQGEYHLRCHKCGAENFVLVRGRSSEGTQPDQTGNTSSSSI